MKRFLLSWLLILLSIFTFSFAAELDWFLVQANPNSFAIGEAIDITVTATSNGQAIDEYTWWIIIEIVGLDDNDYTVPSDGVYIFVPQDQWSKTFSKWLQINKEWTYDLKVYDIIENKISGQTSLIVSNTQGSTDIKKITVNSPTQWGIEEENMINILWSASELPQSPVEFYINKWLVHTATSNVAWEFNVYISGAVVWENILEVKIKNADWDIIWESDPINFRYENNNQDWFKEIKITPTSIINSGDIIHFNVTTINKVDSVSIKFNAGKEFPMQKSSEWIFDKDVAMIYSGDIEISLILTSDGVKQEYKNIKKITVKNLESGIVWDLYSWFNNIKIEAVNHDETRVKIIWEYKWKAEKFKVYYSNDKNKLEDNMVVETTWVLIENISPNIKYYFQISPIDITWNNIENMSDIIEYFYEEDLSCFIKDIKLRTKKIGDKYYIYWNPIKNANKYFVYMSETASKDISTMNKISETTETMFEYPFDKYSETDVYAYYIVQADCKDWSVVMIDQAKQIKVWPMDTALLVILFTFMLYAGYSLYKEAK